VLAVENFALDVAVWIERW